MSLLVRSIQTLTGKLNATGWLAIVLPSPFAVPMMVKFSI